MASNFLGVRVVWLPEGEHSGELGARVNVIRFSGDPDFESIASPAKREREMVFIEVKKD